MTLPGPAGQLPDSIAGYPVRGVLGRGGMGVVYLVHDPRLDRPLAVKVITEAFARESDRIDSIRREARILASLNHPNVATIHGLEDLPDGSFALILEFVEGETLAARVRRGPLASGEVIAIVRQMATALQAAHEKQVVHRDLKPGNVMVTPAGHVKLLDFGLAQRLAPGADDRDGATLSMEIPAAAKSSGTPGYMSPEQARGDPVDARTDIFAFGCVLYECLTGRPAFRERTPIETIAATLAREPDWNAIPRDAPREMRGLIERCLKKDTAARPPSMSAVARALDTMKAAPRPGSAEPRSAKFAGALTSFVGRESELAELHHLVIASRLVTLTGAGGCGKTRLALELARVAGERFPDGVPFVDLAPLREPGQVARAAAEALSVREEGTTSIEQRLAERCADRRMLLLLDNCEHVREGAASLAQGLLEACRDLHIVATSREHLRIPGEQEYRVPSLSVPPLDAERSSETVFGWEAPRLFLERARLVRADWAPSAEDAVHVAEICRHLDGIPLAIELAAARLRVLSTEAIRARLSDRFRFLKADGAASLSRHQTLRAALDWSYELLAPEERSFLRSLSVFAGGWTMEAAVAVCGVGSDEFELLDLLTHLVDKSLVQIERPPSGESRYRLLETVRQYVAETLEAVQRSALRDRHLQYYTSIAEAGAGRFATADQTMWMRRLDAEHENVLAALSWSAEGGGDAESGLRLVSAVWPYWESRGILRAGRAAAEQSLARGGGAASPRLRAGALRAKANLAIPMSDYDAARAAHAECLSIYRELGDRMGVATSHGNLGIVAMDLQDFEAARSHYEEAIEVFRDLGDDSGYAKTVLNLSIVYRNTGDAAKARALQEEALSIQRRLGNRRSTAIVHYNLAVLTLSTGQFDAARENIRAGIEIARDLGDRDVGIILLERASELEGKGADAVRAVRLRGAAQGLRDAIGYPVPLRAMAERDLFLDTMRESLGDEGLRRELERGRRMSLERAWAYALDETDDEGDSTSTKGPGTGHA